MDGLLLVDMCVFTLPDFCSLVVVLFLAVGVFELVGRSLRPCWVMLQAALVVSAARSTDRVHSEAGA